MTTQQIPVSVSKAWFTYQEVQQMFNYKPTQMASLLKQLKIAKVGKRKFILKESLGKLLLNSMIQECPS